MDLRKCVKSIQFTCEIRILKQIYSKMNLGPFLAQSKFSSLFQPYNFLTFSS